MLLNNIFYHFRTKKRVVYTFLVKQMFLVQNIAAFVLFLRAFQNAAPKINRKWEFCRR